MDYYGSDVPLHSRCPNSSVGGCAHAGGLAVEKGGYGRYPIEKAIYVSELGLTPNTAGTVIRVPLLSLTEERRRDITKVVRHDAESARVSVRNVRRDSLTDLKEMLKGKLISQDDERKGQDEIQKLTDRFVAEIDQQLRRSEGNSSGWRRESSQTRRHRRRVTSPSSWMATDAGLGHAEESARTGIAPGSSRCAW